jgi:2-polyprenyl-3-methyl-5-hydroxy-6-metoxy-1,4-benzoquinol methylase
MPPLMQEDIRRHYEDAWKNADNAASDDAGLNYSNPVEDAVLYPIYQQLLNDLKVTVNGGNILDVGCGSGRWVRYFLERFSPASLTGVDFTQSSVDLLRKRYFSGPVASEFRLADLTQPELDLGRKFDLINVMNVLFHIPEPDRFMHAMRNLAAHLAPGGRIVTTEYLPRQTMRTNWMLVRSRYDFDAAVAAVGLRTIAVRATGFFSNDPMGIEGHDAGVRNQFYAVKAGMNQILSLSSDANAKSFFVKFLSDVENSCLNFCRERMSEQELPSQKLVVLGR